MSDDEGGVADDDDGVRFLTNIFVGQTDAEITLEVNNAPSGALVDAWIDFNNDGNWSGNGERIAIAFPVVNGQNTLTFDVPPTAARGMSIARVRISSVGRLAPGGLAPDGEVEDEAVFIQTPPLPRILTVGNTLVSLPNLPASLAMADLDGDGALDLIMGLSNGVDAFVWFRNQGDVEFVRELLIDGIDAPRATTSADIDQDGDQDLVTIDETLGQLAWIENARGDTSPTTRRRPWSAGIWATRCRLATWLTSARFNRA